MLNLEKLKEKKSIQELLEFGIIIFDKPQNCTSFDVCEFVKKELKLKKTSHFGTLDPMVTGVLPIALGRACKLTGFFLGEDKEYEGVMRIHEEKDLKQVQEIINKKFTGIITQLPPVRSSVKRQEREREIKDFKLLGQEDKKISFKVACQGGTYIRKLVHDLGEEMQIGAHMIGLKRIRAGIFTEKQMVTKEEFEKAVEKYKKGDETKLREIIIPAEIISRVYPIVELKKADLDRVLHGAPIMSDMIETKGTFKKNQIVSLFSGEKFVGMFKIVNEGRTLALPMFVLQPIK